MLRQKTTKRAPGAIGKPPASSRRSDTRSVGRIATQAVTFQGSQGTSLAARLELPTGETLGYALFAHCFTCSKDVFAAARIASLLADQGIAVLRFDFTGLGSSAGDFANTNFSSNVQDLVMAASFLREDYAAPKLLIGHSLGGAAVLAAAAELPEVAAVSTIAAPSDPGHLRELLGPVIPEIEARGEVAVRLAGREFRIRRQFLDDIAEQRLHDVIRGLHRPLMIFHAPTDDVVDIQHARQIFDAAMHPKSFVALDGADHMLSRREDAVFVARVLAAWSSRYIRSANDREE